MEIEKDTLEHKNKVDNREKKIMEEKEKTEHEAENAYYNTIPNLSKRGPSKLRQQFSRGLSIFLVLAACIAFYFALLRVTNLSDVFSKIIRVMQPVIYGCVIAYLLNPIVKQVDRHLVPVLEKRLKNSESAKKISRGAGVACALVFMILVIVLLCNLLIPELYVSIRDMIYTLPGQINDLVQQINEISTGKSTMSQLLRTIINEGSDMLEKWLRTYLLPKTNELMSNLTVGVINVINAIFDFLIGIIVSIYLLFSREKFSGQCKKTVYALLSPEHANTVLHFVSKSNEIFGGFIIGKLIDSAIIGVLCFIGMSILKLPYTVLVSVIIGVTNIIPFFGPYIGAIPSTILIMLSNPMQGVYFLIFILILQQFDGNILGPKILGNSTGLSAFWVIVAILLGGGLFGFVGMIMGVPTFAVLYYMVELYIDSKLKKKNLPADTESYDARSYVDSAGVYRKGKQK